MKVLICSYSIHKSLVLGCSHKVVCHQLGHGLRSWTRIQHLMPQQQNSTHILKIVPVIFCVSCILFMSSLASFKPGSNISNTFSIHLVPFNHEVRSGLHDKGIHNILTTLMTKTTKCQFLSCIPSIYFPKHQYHLAVSEFFLSNFASLLWLLGMSYQYPYSQDFPDISSTFRHQISGFFLNYAQFHLIDLLWDIPLRKDMTFAKIQQI